MYNLGDTLSNINSEKLIVFMTFFAPSKEDESKILKGFWAFDEAFKVVKPYYMDKEEIFNDEHHSNDDFKRSKILLIEKDYNKILNKEVANKYISILLTHL